MRELSNFQLSVLVNFVIIVLAICSMNSKLEKIMERLDIDE